MKRRPSLFFFALAAAMSLGYAQDVQPVKKVTVSDTNAVKVPDPESLLIGKGDLLHVSVFREPDLEQRLRVQDSGEIDLSLAGPVKVAELTPGDAAKVVEKAYLQGHFLNHPQVSIFVDEYATQNVAVLGQVARPGAVPLATPRSLLDVLSLSGGLTELADRHITVQRADKSSTVSVFLPNDSAASLNASVTVYPGDTVLVPKAGLVYVLGDVGRPGGYVMQDDSKLTVLQAVSLAAGANKTAKEGAIRLIRRVDGNLREQTVPLSDIERGRKPDMQLEANDVLYVPFSMAKHITMGAAGIVSSAGSAAIYATR